MLFTASAEVVLTIQSDYSGKSLYILLIIIHINERRVWLYKNTSLHIYIGALVRCP